MHGHENTQMTYRRLLDTIRQPGNVHMPVLMKHGVVHIEAKKVDLIFYLQQGDVKVTAPWTHSYLENGDHWLEVNDEA